MEYGRIVGESTGVAGGGGGSRDITGQIMDAATDAVDQVAALPTPVLIGAIVVVVVLIVLIRR